MDVQTTARHLRRDLARLVIKLIDRSGNVPTPRGRGVETVSV